MGILVQVEHQKLNDDDLHYRSPSQSVTSSLFTTFGKRVGNRDEAAPHIDSIKWVTSPIFWMMLPDSHPLKKWTGTGTWNLALIRV